MKIIFFSIVTSIVVLFSGVSRADFFTEDTSYTTPAEVLERIKTPVENFSNPGCLMFQIRQGAEFALHVAAGFSIISINISQVSPEVNVRSKAQVEFTYQHHTTGDLSYDIFHCYIEE